MPFYAGTTRVNLNSASSLYQPSDSSGATCNLSSSGTATPFYANGTQIYITPEVQYVTLTLKIGGSYATSYRGTLRLREGTASGTIVWSYNVTSSTSSGTTLGTYQAKSGTTYYMEGDEYSTARYVFYTNPTFLTPTEATTVTFTIYRQSATACPNLACTSNAGFN